MNIRISRTNIWDSNYLSYSSQDISYPAANSKQRWKDRPWHTQNTYVSNQWLKSYNYDKPAWNMLVILGHNFQLGAEVRIQSSDDNFATIPIDVLLPVTADTIVYFSPTNIAYQYTRIYITDASNPDGYLAIGRVFLGLYLEPRWGYSPAREEDSEDPSIIGEAEHGQATAILRTQYATISYQFDGVNVADQAEWRAHFFEFGKAKPFFIVEHPELADQELRTLYVRALTFSWSPMASPIKALQLEVQTER